MSGTLKVWPQDQDTCPHTAPRPREYMGGMNTGDDQCLDCGLATSPAIWRCIDDNRPAYELAEVVKRLLQAISRPRGGFARPTIETAVADAKAVLQRYETSI